MSTIYRTVFSDERDELIVGARDLFSGWLLGKGIAVEVPESGRAAAEDG